ncbi:DUF2971 domain-containing protein [Vibrio parahaemolyticus]
MSGNLFKFFPCNSHDLDALANNYLWFSNYSNFNDPFEDVFINNAFYADFPEYDEVKAIKFFKRLLSEQIPPHDLEALLLEMKLDGTFQQKYRELVQETFDGTVDGLKSFVSKSKATCFARDSDNNKALQNKLMWSHYADGLRGFCVEYNHQELVDGISERSGNRIILCPMKYGQLKRYSFEELVHNTAKSMNLPGDHFGIGSLVSMKSSEWEYENEYRLITDGDNCVYIPSSSIKSITIGSKMPESKRNTLLSILKGNQELTCDIYEAYIDLESFGLKHRLLHTVKGQA